MHDKEALPYRLRGRGAESNPAGRFEPLAVQFDPLPVDDGESPLLRTQYFRDPSRSIVSFNDSPDVGMAATVNPYRGCEHGCIYCYARPTHEYLGFSAGLDFESRIFVKTDAPALLRKALSAPGWQPQTLGFSGVTDPYQPVERRLQLTRQCLEVLAEFRNPVAIITKNALVTRDIDILSRLAEHQAVRVFLSITTLDAELARTLEPRTSRPDLKLEALRKLHAAGIPTGVMMAPVIPGLTEHEIPAVLEAAAGAGADTAAYVMLRLPHGVKDLFAEWLETHRPLRKDKVLNRIREIRGGQLNSHAFGDRMRGQGIHADIISQLFHRHLQRLGLDKPLIPLSTGAFRRETRQGSLFD